jgi:cell division septation protein DedD|uniref:SPOR domain-containing protein n=1 Tax=Meiothermus ruber TaxID=277 RepID=A0A7C3DCV7_MEIRU
MGWIRANWLDALIFLLVAAIMAGVVFFLLGINPFSGPQGNPTPPQTVAPLAPQQTQPPAPQPNPPTPSQPKPQTEPETVVTLLPIPQAPTAPVAPSKPVPAPPKVAEKKTPSPQPEATATPKAERPSLAADPEGGWRVMVGSFSNRENAERLAATLRGQGYPVGLEAAGNLTRVWVGPYNSQDRARAIASTLSQYQPQVGRVPAAAPTPEVSPRASRYLQVGAFRNAQSAQAAIEAVQQAGYPVVLVEEGGLVKVRVGPFEDTAAAAADLRARGLEVLEVR